MNMKRCLALGFALLYLAPSAFSKSPVSVNQVPPVVESTARGFEHLLRQRGFDASRGYFRLYTTADCPTGCGIKIRLGEDADDFVPLIRYAKPDDGGGIGTRSNAWRTDLPMIVLWVRYSYTSRAPEPYPAVALESRTA